MGFHQILPWRSVSAIEPLASRAGVWILDAPRFARAWRNSRNRTGSPSDGCLVATVAANAWPPMTGARGRTSLIPLLHIVPEGSARVLLKLEYENPTGSMKARMALAMVTDTMVRRVKTSLQM